jgi:hypothetical protein
MRKPCTLLLVSPRGARGLFPVAQALTTHEGFVFAGHSATPQSWTSVGTLLRASREAERLLFVARDGEAAVATALWFAALWPQRRLAGATLLSEAGAGAGGAPLLLDVRLAVGGGAGLAGLRAVADLAPTWPCVPLPPPQVETVVWAAQVAASLAAHATNPAPLQLT